MNKKIGIITLYYNSLNFGGVLQAYALCEALKQQGYNAEQILVQREGVIKHRKKAWYEFFNLKKVIKKIISVLKDKRKKRKNDTLSNIVEERKLAFESFYNLVPHSKVFLESKISDCLDNYDIFITGSDQVWSCGEIDSPYFLGFVKEDKKKISYAASIGKMEVDERLKECFLSHLDKFNAISVRESNAVSLLQPFTKNEVQFVLDPTLLLTSEDWNNLSSDRKIDFPYMLCYFLGNDKSHRKLAKDYAKKHGLKIACFPHYPSNYHSADKKFGDFLLTDASPQDFLALIKNAKVVLTDSFHASVFSWFFKRQFFTFGRKSHKGMEGRLYSLLEILNLKDRFVYNVNKNTLNYLESLEDIDYNQDFDKYVELKQKSINFLVKALKD